VETLGPAEFAGEELRRPGTVVVAFLAEWCPFCVDFKPEFEARAEASRVAFAYADLTEYANPLWEQFAVEVVPTVVAFEGGRATWRVDGIRGRGIPLPKLDAQLRPWAKGSVTA
jgi:thioredoxin-like negative regulator of GroEL